MADQSSRADADFVSLLTTTQLPLRLYIYSLLAGDPNASDVVQQTNAKIWEKRSEFSLGTNFKAWAFAVARFEVMTYRKQSARDAKLSFRDDLQQTLTDELSALPDDLLERHAALKRCLANLRPQDRELLLQRYANSGTLAEYAALINRSLSGLKVTLHRLRNRLLTCIQRTLAEGTQS